MSSAIAALAQAGLIRLRLRRAAKRDKPAREAAQAKAATVNPKDKRT